MYEILQQINDLFQKKKSFVMVTILEKSGSAPREKGTKMLVKEDFSIVGTIGGGMVEALAIKEAAKVRETMEYAIKDYSLSNNEASSIGMVCGGSVKVLLEYIDSSDSNMVKIYDTALRLSVRGEDFVMITKVSEKNGYITGRDKWICTETGFYGTEDEQVQPIARKIRESFKAMDIEFMHTNDRYLAESFHLKDKVCIFGAGHISKELTNVMKMLDFYTVVVDDRAEFANADRFPRADEVKVIASYENLLQYIDVDRNTYIVIVTRGHNHDKEVLAQMLKTDAKYVGMIGSKSKREITYQKLRDNGYTQNDIDRVFCPIGLSISAQTPAEIAISIAAELIQVKRGK